MPGRGEEGGGQNEDENRRTQVQIVGEDLPPLRGSGPRSPKRLRMWSYLHWQVKPPRGLLTDLPHGREHKSADDPVDRPQLPAIKDRGRPRRNRNPRPAADEKTRLMPLGSGRSAAAVGEHGTRGQGAFSRNPIRRVTKGPLMKNFQDFLALNLLAGAVVLYATCGPAAGQVGQRGMSSRGVNAVGSRNSMPRRAAPPVTTGPLNNGAIYLVEMPLEVVRSILGISPSSPGRGSTSTHPQPISGAVKCRPKETSARQVLCPRIVRGRAFDLG